MTVGYYANIIRGSRVSFLAGPFATAAEAVIILPTAFKLAVDLDPFAHFDLHGTCSRAADVVGVLNGRLGLPTTLTECLASFEGDEETA